MRRWTLLLLLATAEGANAAMPRIALEITPEPGSATPLSFAAPALSAGLSEAPAQIFKIPGFANFSVSPSAAPTPANPRAIDALRANAPLAEKLSISVRRGSAEDSSRSLESNFNAAASLDSNGDVSSSAPSPLVHKAPETLTDDQFAHRHRYAKYRKDDPHPFDLDPSLLRIDIPAGIAAAKNLSQVARKSGIAGLVHYAPSDAFVPILRHGSLDYRESERRINASWNPGNYLGLFKMPALGGPISRTRTNESPKNVYLVFDADLLDRKDYYVNHREPYGNHTESSMPFSDPRLRRYLYLTGRGILENKNEVLFANPIPLGTLRTIIVEPGEKKGWIKLLKTNRVPFPVKSAASWEDLIVEMDPYSLFQQ